MVGKDIFLQVQLPRGHSLPFKNGNSNLVIFSKQTNRQANKLKEGSCRDPCIPVPGDNE